MSTAGYGWLHVCVGRGAARSMQCVLAPHQMLAVTFCLVHVYPLLSAPSRKRYCAAVKRRSVPRHDASRSASQHMHAWDTCSHHEAAVRCSWSRPVSQRQASVFHKIIATFSTSACCHGGEKPHVMAPASCLLYTVLCMYVLAPQHSPHTRGHGWPHLTATRQDQEGMLHVRCTGAQALLRRRQLVRLRESAA